jgi:hypothetical protein
MVFCSIEPFSKNCKFGTTFSSMNYRRGYLRGQLLPPNKEELSIKFNSYSNALDYLLKDPEKTLQNIKKEDVNKLLNIVSKYIEK